MIFGVNAKGRRGKAQHAEANFDRDKAHVAPDPDLRQRVERPPMAPWVNREPDRATGS